MALRLLLSYCLLIVPLLPAFSQKVAPAVQYDQGRIVGNNGIQLKNGNGTLGQIYNTSACGLNYCSASMMTATRFSPSPGPGFPSSLNISCLPTCFNVLQAYLWWSESSSNNSATATITPPGGGATAIAASLIGSGGSKCWPAASTRVFRADITSAITTNGNYTINISSGGSVVDGVTLFIIYTDPTATYQGTLVIDDGAMTIMGGTQTHTISGFSACGPSTSASAFAIGGDMQNNVGATHSTTLNGATSSFGQNFWNFDQTNTTVSSGQSTSLFAFAPPSSDCWVFVATGLYFQTTSCVTCTPSGALTSTPSQVNDACSMCIGSASVSVSGGSVPYTYAWSTGPTTNSISGLCAGSYSVTVVDASGCNTAIENYTITNAGGVLGLAMGSTDALCFGECTGTVSATASGGTAPYTYNWSGLGLGQNQTNVCAGTYTLNVTDANGCTGTSTATVAQPNAIDLFAIPLDETCAGYCDGTLWAATTGGSSPFTFTWDGGLGNGQGPVGVCPGTYTVTVVDVNGCVEQNTFSSTTTINPGPAASAGFTYNGNQCITGNNYIFTNTGSSGVTYSWVFGDGNTSTAENPSNVYAAPGTYTVTQTVTNGSCSETSSLTVVVNTGPAGTTAGMNVTCAGNCDGSINLTPAGGTSPYTFLWSNAATTEDLSGLCVGTYDVTITDASGCAGTASAVIGTPPGLSAVYSGTSVLCNGSCNGTAVATPSGGTGPYTYSWDDPGFQNTTTATGLCAGLASVTVTDAGGCSVSGSYNVTQPSAVVLTLSAVDASCGMTDGSVTATISGGTLPFTYLWNSGCTTSSCTGLGSGTYLLSFTDGSGCTAVGMISVNDLGGGGVASAVVDVNLACPGVCIGQATGSISGGASPFTYLWDDGATQTTSVATGLCAGTYSVAVTDGIGCTSSASITITEPTALNAVITSSTDALCFGVCDGSALVSVSGGTTPYTYSWNNPGGSTNPSTGLDLCASTTYTATVTDAGGCTATATISVSEPTQVTASIVGTDALCNGGNTGSADLTPGGGTSPYNFSWSNTDITEDLTNVIAGTYLVTVTDQFSCPATASVVIGEPSALTLSTTVVDAACGLANGSSCVTPIGGTGSYTYIWNDTLNQTTSCAATLPGGAYMVTVVDANNCSDVANVTVNDIPGGNAVATLVSNTSGFSLCDGSASATLTSGTTPYTYIWDDSSTQSTSTATGLCAGSYCVTITDAVGCTSSDCITISEPPPIGSVITGVDLVCNSACNGSATLAVAGGNAPYTFLWTGGATTQNISGLCAGTYIVTITDANSIPVYDSIEILEPLALVLTTTGTDAVCNNACDGTAQVSVTGGTGAYTYQWDDPGLQTTVTAIGLCAGVYDVTVTDGNGCTASESYTINEPLAVIVAVTNVDANCGQADGSVTATVTNGTGAFTYQWSTSCSNSTCTGLLANSYDVTVTDLTGCTGVGAGAIADLNGPTAGMIDSVDATCSGGTDGQATVLVSDGTFPYTYSWNTSPGETTANATDLPAGTTIISIADANGCVTSVNVLIGDPPPLVATTTSSDPSCNGSCNGFGSVSVVGGTTPYTFLWNDPSAQTTASASMLCQGIFGVNVEDANGCTAMGSVTLTDPATLVLSINSSDAYCGGSCDGSSNVSAFGGTSPYGYSWNTSPVQTTQMVDSLCAATYIITVSDSNGCTASSTSIISEPTALIASISSSGDVSCNGLCDGFAQSGVSGGVAPYTYLWSNSITTDQVTNLCAGIYDLTVTDANGCSAITAVTISAPPAMIGTMTQQNVSCNTLCDGVASVAVSGGMLPYTYLWNDTYLQSTFLADSLCAGSFSVNITDFNGCAITRTVNITEPQPLSFVSTTSPSTCGNQNGGACVAVVGGLVPYTITWNDPSVTVGTCIDSVFANVYNPVLVDGNGCAYTNPVIINDITGPIIDSISTTDLACFGDASGTATVYYTGGTSPYTYTWKDGVGVPFSTGSSFVSGLSGGTYTITIVDFNGCTVSQLFSIVEPLQIVSAITGSSNISCFGACDGTATVIAGNGTPPYTYNWTPSMVSAASATGLCGGVNNVLIIDANGCQTVDGVTLAEPAELAISFVMSNVSCNGSNDGQIMVTPSGGSQPYTYLWLPGGSGTGTMVTSLGAGSYTVQVTDMNQCDTNAVFVISEPSLLVATGSSWPSSCGDANGEAFVNPMGGTPSYSYEWFDDQNAPLGQSTDNAVGLVQGTFAVVTTDANGCQFSLPLQVADDEGPTIAFITSTDVFCNGENTGTATVAKTGGTFPFTYAWNTNPIQTDSVASNLVAGSYSVTLTDLNGCTDTATVIVTEPPPIVVQMSNDTTICVGGMATIGIVATGGTSSLGGPNPVFDYLWDTGDITAFINVNPSVETTYDVTATDLNNCPATGSVIVSFYDPLVVTVNSDMICLGDYATLTATVTGGNVNNNTTYQWDDPALSTSGSITVSPLASTNYSVIVGDQSCSPNTFGVGSIQVNDPPTVDFTWACDPDPFALTFTSTSNPPPGGATLTTWAWDFGDQSTSNEIGPDHEYTSSQTYSVTLVVTTNQNCSATATHDVEAPPTAEFIITQNGEVLDSAKTSILSPVVDFVDASSSDVIWWFWEFGDGDSITVQDPDFQGGDSVSHSFNDPGTYEVMLTVQNQTGCIDTAMHQLVVEAEFVLFTPNTFTPDGDGKNDFFFPQGIGVDEESFSFYVFDRWGDMVFESSGAFKDVIGWDGKANDGSEVSQLDVYIWLIRTEDQNGDAHEYVGHVTILR